MEGRELPVGWELISLSEAGFWGSGGTPSRKSLEYYGGNIPWFKTGELGPRVIDQAEEHITESGIANSSAKIFRPGSVVIAMYGATIGKVSILGIPAATNQACAVAEVDQEITTSDFLFHYLCSQRDQFAQAGKGGAQPNISQGLLKSWPFPLPPLNEQRRIAAKLDTTLAAVDACRQRLDGVAAILKRFRQAVLAAATSGELTREWRQERGIDWAPRDLCIGDLGKVITGNTPPALKEDSEEQFPLFKPSDLDPGYEVRTARDLMGPIRAQGSRLLPAMSVLVTCIGATVGKTGLARVAGATNQQINAVICDSSVALPEWTYFWLASPIGQSSVVGNASATTLPIINKSRFSALRLKVPSVTEQQEIVRRVEELFTLADQLEARLRSARKVVDRLTPALLAKAFRGELVLQDPSDEPASVLLERLAAKRVAARQAEAAAGKPSRRGRPKAAANPAPVDRNAAPDPSEPLPPDLLTQLLRECGALSERALLAVSELEPERFEQQLFRELEKGTAREVQANGQVLLEAVG